MVLRLCIVVELFCLPVRNIFPRISLHELPYHRTMRKCSLQVYISVIVYIIFACQTLSPSTTRQKMVKNDVGSPKSTSFMSIFHIGSMFCFLPTSLISSTYPEKNSPFSRLTKKHSKFKTFSQPCSNRNFLELHFPQWSCQRMTVQVSRKRNDWIFHTGHDLGHLCSGTRTQISGHSDFGFFNSDGASSILTWVWADIASAACPAHPGSRDKIHMTFAAVICDADDPCSVNTAYDPASSFTMSPRSTNRSLYFWNCGSKSDFVAPLASWSIATCPVESLDAPIPSFSGTITLLGASLFHGCIDTRRWILWCVLFKPLTPLSTPLLHHAVRANSSSIRVLHSSLCLRRGPSLLVCNRMHSGHPWQIHAHRLKPPVAIEPFLARSLAHPIGRSVKHWTALAVLLAPVTILVKLYQSPL